MKAAVAIKETLSRIYGTEKGEEAFKRIRSLIDRFSARKKRNRYGFSRKDTVLIVYGDTLNKPGEPPLKTLRQFAEKYLKDVFNTIHILPFFPYSSDDGFSVMDYFAVNPKLGDWNDIRSLGRHFRLMFDFVVNHISSKSEWFHNYLNGIEGFESLAIEVEDPESKKSELSKVTRPRSLPLLTGFTKTDGKKVQLWTTISEDQIDLNYKSIDVLEKMMAALLFYIEKGAKVIRMDAIAYLWKEIGTNCIHLPQTHDMVKLMRQILDIVAPDVIILTETNVPHAENTSYFGNGYDEAQMVYNFTLPPLLLYTIIKEDASILTRWVKTLELPSRNVTLLNFTASHDGIGVRPLEGILDKTERDILLEVVKKNGGNVSYKKNPDGTESPYELNITYIDALKTDNEKMHIQRFMASQVIQYSLPGVPATYIHSLLGSENWLDGVKATGRARTINREKLNVADLELQLNDPNSFRSKIFSDYLKMVKIRIVQPAFHPTAAFEIMDLGPKIFAVKRQSEKQTINAIVNVTSKRTVLDLKATVGKPKATDLITGKTIESENTVLFPLQYLWLE